MSTVNSNNNITSPNSAQNESSSSEEYVPRSNNSYYKPFGGWPNFMASYGLKPWNPADVEEGKAIVEAFKEEDRYEWEEAQRQKK